MGEGVAAQHVPNTRQKIACIAQLRVHVQASLHLAKLSIIQQWAITVIKLDGLSSCILSTTSFMARQFDASVLHVLLVESVDVLYLLTAACIDVYLYLGCSIKNATCGLHFLFLHHSF